MLPFNIISEVSRTLALAVRLFGNMMSGAMILAILLTITPFFFPVVMTLLVWLLKRFLYRPVLNAIDRREQQVAKVLATAEATRTEAQGLSFEATPALVAGIELSANGQKLAWSIDDYLGALQRGVDELLQPAATAAPSTSAASAAPAAPAAPVEPPTPAEPTAPAPDPAAAQ